MNFSRAIAILMLTMSTITVSEELDSYNGTWEVQMITGKGDHLEGVVEIHQQEGTWKMYSECVRLKCPCKGLRAPIVIKETASDELVLNVLKSKSLRGCSDRTASLKRLEDGTLSGELDNGSKLVLKKK